MNRGIEVAVLCLFCATAAWGWGSLVASYAAPGDGPYGLGYINSTYVCCATDSPNLIWRLYRSSSSVASSFAAPHTETTGVAFGLINPNGYIWVADANSDHVYRVGWNSGSIYSSFATPGNVPVGLAFAQEGSDYILYHTDYAEKHLYRLRATTGSIFGSYSLPYTPRDLGYGGGYLWIADQTNRVIHAATTTGSTVASFPTPPGPPIGVCYNKFNDYVWVSFCDGLNYLFVYETEGIGVAPDSLGRVKALFR